MNVIQFLIVDLLYIMGQEFKNLHIKLHMEVKFFKKIKLTFKHQFRGQELLFLIQHQLNQIKNLWILQIQNKL